MQKLSAVNANVICMTCTVITTLLSAPQVAAMQQQGQQLLEMHTTIEQQLEPRLRAHSHSEAPPDLAYVVRERQLALSLVGLTAEEGTAANLAELVHNSQSSAAVAAASLQDLTSSAAAPPLHAPQPALPMVQPPPQSFLGLPTPTNHSRVQPALTTAATAAAGQQLTAAGAAAAVQQLAQQTFPSAPVFTGAAAAAASAVQQLAQQTFPSAPVFTGAEAAAAAVQQSTPAAAAAAVQQLAQQTCTSANDGPQGVTCGHCHAGSGVRCTWVPRKALYSQVELY